MLTILLKKEIKQLRKKYDLSAKDPTYWDWYRISKHEFLSEEFITEFKNYINWHFVSATQNISEKLIKDNQDKVNWFLISYQQKLSEEFVKEFLFKLDLKAIVSCQECGYKFKHLLPFI